MNHVKRIKYITFLACVTLCVSAPHAVASVVYAPVAGTASSTTPGYGIEHSFDQSGLSINYVSGVTDFDSYIASNPYHSYLAANDWFSSGSNWYQNATIEFDLGSVKSVDGFALWNEENAGIRQANVSISSDGVNFTSLMTVNPLWNNWTVTQYLPETFGFTAVDARYFRMELISCPPNSGVGWYCSMGEIAFSVSAVPVPPAVWLFGSGLLGLVGIARREARV